MQISSNYSMNGVPYENRRRQNDIPQFSTERAEQENERSVCLLKNMLQNHSINKCMEIPLRLKL